MESNRSPRTHMTNAPPEAAVAGADGIVNAISLYVERGTDTFHSVHVETAARIARAARQAGIRRFVHLSGIGANTASSSPYIRSRGEGEAAVQTAFPGAVIVRPAVMFAPDDAFLTAILRLLRSLPAYPIFGDGRARLQPVYVEDVAAAIAQILRQSQKPHLIYELAGPRVYSYEELLRTIAALDDVAYAALAKPSKGVPPTTYHSVDPKFLERIVDETIAGPGKAGAAGASSPPRHAGG